MKRGLLAISLFCLLLVSVKLGIAASGSAASFDPKSFNNTFTPGAESNVPNYTSNHPSYNTNNLEESAKVEAGKNDSAILAKDIYRKQDFKFTGKEAAFNGAKTAMRDAKLNNLEIQYQDCKAPNQEQKCSEYLSSVKQYCEASVVNDSDLQIFSCLKEKRPETKTCQKQLDFTCTNLSYDFPRIISNNFTGFNYNFPYLYLGTDANNLGGNCGGYNWEFKFNLGSVDSVESLKMLNIHWDDSVTVSVNNNNVFVESGGGCERGRVASNSPNVNLKPYLKAGENIIKARLVVGGTGRFWTQIEFKYKKCQSFTQNWLDNCPTLANDKRCQFREKTCQDNQSRVILENDIIQECFQYQESYSCVPEGFNFDSCNVFKEDTTCSQLTTQCLNYLGEECYKFQNRYECSEKKELSSYEGITYENSSQNPSQTIDDSNCQKYSRDRACALSSETCLLKDSQNHCQKFSREYSCSQNENALCKILNQNCTLNSSICVKKDESNQCLINDKTYSCPASFNQSSNQNQVLICGSQFYPQDNNQAKPDNNFGKAVTMLMMLSEAGKDFDANTLKIFNGSGGFCDKSLVGYNDCCKESGWGQDAGLASCSASEQNLASMKANRQCVYVGSFCSDEEDLTGTCLKTTKSYCCFKSRLARLVHEQARGQVGLGFGSAEAPNCRGFTQEELGRIDFTVINWDELVSDSTKNMTIPDDKKMLEKTGQRIDQFFNQFQSEEAQ